MHRLTVLANFYRYFTVNAVAEEVELQVIFLVHCVCKICGDVWWLLVLIFMVRSESKILCMVLLVRFIEHCSIPLVHLATSI